MQHSEYTNNKIYIKGSGASVNWKAFINPKKLNFIDRNYENRSLTIFALNIYKYQICIYKQMFIPIISFAIVIHTYVTTRM